MFTAALFTIAKTLKQSKCPSTDKWIKMCYMCIYEIIYIYIYTDIHTHTMEYYLAFKNNGIVPFSATWMNLENTILCEIRKTNNI